MLAPDLYLITQHGAYMSDYTEYYQQAWERFFIKNHTTHHDGCDCVMNKIQKLENENARLREALEFYASTSSWRGENGEDFKILFEDVSLPNNSSSYVGGRRAREALKGGE